MARVEFITCDRCGADVDPDLVNQFFTRLRAKVSPTWHYLELCDPCNDNAMQWHNAGRPVTTRQQRVESRRLLKESPPVMADLPAEPIPARPPSSRREYQLRVPVRVESAPGLTVATPTPSAVPERGGSGGSDNVVPA